MQLTPLYAVLGEDEGQRRLAEALMARYTEVLHSTHVETISTASWHIRIRIRHIICELQPLADPAGYAWGIVISAKHEADPVWVAWLTLATLCFALDCKIWISTYPITQFQEFGTAQPLDLCGRSGFVMNSADLRPMFSYLRGEFDFEAIALIKSETAARLIPQDR